MRTLIILLLFVSNLEATTDRQRADLLLSIRNNKVSKFVNSIYPDAVHVKEKYGVPLAVTIGMSMLETGFGESRLCREDLNYFGIRVNHKYKKYNTRRECFDHYGRVLTAKCYRNLKPFTFKEWYNALTCCKYFTSKTYIRKLNNLIFKYNLDLLV